ncbi:MAG: hypothetical protein ACYCZB_08290 [Acidiphilium sp.]
MRAPAAGQRDGVAAGKAVDGDAAAQQRVFQHQRAAAGAEDEGLVGHPVAEARHGASGETDGAAAGERAAREIERAAGKGDETGVLEFGAPDFQRAAGTDRNGTFIGEAGGLRAGETADRAKIHHHIQRAAAVDRDLALIDHGIRAVERGRAGNRDCGAGAERDRAAIADQGGIAAAGGLKRQGRVDDRARVDRGGQAGDRRHDTHAGHHASRPVRGGTPVGRRRGRGLEGLGRRVGHRNPPAPAGTLWCRHAPRRRYFCA